MLLELKQRFNAVMEVLRDGLTVVEIAERYGVSRQAVHGWLRRHHPGWGQRRLAHELIRDGISGTPPRRSPSGQGDASP